MQRVVGVSWAKPDSDNALFGKNDLGVAPTEGQHAVAPRANPNLLFQEMRAFVAPHSGFGACETEISAAKKVARYNRRSNLPRCLAPIHDRGMMRHKAES
jgi:hypothetical protein